MAASYITGYTITDLQTLAEYHWTLETPWPLALTAGQVQQIQQILAGALPATPYGYKVSAAVQSTTTTTDTIATPYPDVDVAPTP